MIFLSFDNEVGYQKHESWMFLLEGILQEV